MYATCYDPKICTHTKFGIPTSNYILICSGLDVKDLEPVGNSPGPKKYGTATINTIGDLMWVQF